MCAVQNAQKMNGPQSRAGLFCKLVGDVLPIPQTFPVASTALRQYHPRDIVYQSWGYAPTHPPRFSEFLNRGVSPTRKQIGKHPGASVPTRGPSPFASNRSLSNVGPPDGQVRYLFSPGRIASP